MKLSLNSARPSARHGLRRRAVSVLAASGLLVAAATSMAGGGVATAGGVHVGSPGAPITIIIHTPHPDCWVCVD